MSRAFWMVLLFVSFLPGARAETLNLQQAIQRAMTADPRISETKQLVEVARAMLQEATGSSAPKFDVNAFLGIAPGVEGGFYEGKATSCDQLPCKPRSDLYSFKNGLSPWTSVTFRIVKPLYTFGKIENYAAAAQGNVDVKREDVRIQRDKTRLQVVQAYYGYLAARDTRYLLEEVQQRLANTQKLVEDWLQEGKGDVKQSDLYALQTGQAIVAKNLAQAHAVEQVALDGLKVLTGLGLDHELEIADNHIRPVPLPTDKLVDLEKRAIAKRPEMSQLEAGLRARRALVAANRAEKKPNIYVGLAGNLSVSPNRDRLDNPYVLDPFNYAAFTPVVGVQWEWASGVQPAKVARAQAELNALVEKADYARMGIPYEVAEAYYKTQGYHKSVQEMEKGSRSGRRWMISRYADFQAGLEKPSRVLEAFQGYILAYSDYLSTVNDYNVQVAKLMSVSGGDE
jgi:outer membrane protein